MKKYVCYGDFVFSKNDGDIHYITGRRLADLYHVDPKECVFIDREDYNMYGQLKFPIKKIENLIPLKPSYEGYYHNPNIKKKIIFLDFDGVVNTIYFDQNGKGDYGSGSDNKVNNWQAICWLNELYGKVPYSIVVTSCWRTSRTNEELQTILYNSGLNKEIEILGKTIELNTHKGDYTFKLFGHWFCKHTSRGREIDYWLRNFNTLPNDLPIKINHTTNNFIILDDDKDMWKHKKHLIQTTQAGFTVVEYDKVLNKWKQ